jgi:hypothetical protein
VQKEDQKREEERALLLAEAHEVVSKLREEHAVLEEEKAAMEEAHAFQKKKVLLNVGRWHRFETRCIPSRLPRTLSRCSPLYSSLPPTPRARIPSTMTVSTSDTSSTSFESPGASS